MLYHVYIGKTAIVAYDILALAYHKAEKLKAKYPEDKITIQWRQGFEHNVREV